MHNAELSRRASFRVALYQFQNPYPLDIRARVYALVVGEADSVDNSNLRQTTSFSSLLEESSNGPKCFLNAQNCKIRIPFDNALTRQFTVTIFHDSSR